MKGVESWQYFPDFWEGDIRDERGYRMDYDIRYPLNRSLEDWEEDEWHSYHAHIEVLCAAMSNLRLIEWFLVDNIVDYPIGMIPFWEWRIIRPKKGKSPFILRTLKNWPYRNPLSLPARWSMTRGMSHIYLRSYD
jgi:hypothetical protein